MKIKALSILSIVGLFASSMLLSSSVLAGDHKKNHRYDNSYVTKRVVVKETPRSTKRIVTTTYKAKDHRYKKHQRENYSARYHRSAPRFVTKRVVVQQPVQRHYTHHRVDSHNGLGLLVGGIVLGGILANH